MHTTIAASKAGQLRLGTTLAAITSMATAAPIFNISQNMNPEAEAIGELVDFVMPRASRMFGTTTDAAPYNADQKPVAVAITAAATPAHIMPTKACAAMTRQGENQVRD